MTWIVNGLEINHYSQKLTIHQTEEDGGSLMSKLTIADAQVEDTGSYICRAINQYGTKEQTYQLNVKGK